MHVDSERWVGKYPRGKFFQAICSLRIQINTRHLGLGSRGEGEREREEKGKEEKEKVRQRRSMTGYRLERDRGIEWREGGGVTRATSHRSPHPPLQF